MNAKRRQRPAHSWDRLNGTRMEVLEVPGGVVRRLCVNIADPLPAVVSFGVHALTMNATESATLRLLAVDNYNADPRELFQIPEAVAWFRRLWMDGKPLLRLLTECSADTPADDRLGMSQREVNTLGLGWFNVYTYGMCRLEAAEMKHGPEGPSWGLAMSGVAGRDDVRAELLQMSADTPEGYTYTAATDRRWFMEQNAPKVAEAAREVMAAGGTDHAVLLLSLDDYAGGRMAQAVAHKLPGFATDVAAHRAKGLHPAVVCAVPRDVVAVALDVFAPGAAQRVAAGPPEGGGMWVACVAFGGTMLTVWDGAQ